MAQYDGNSTNVTHYILGASGVAGTMTLDDSQTVSQTGYFPSYSFFLYDGMGSVVGIVDRHGDILNDTGSNCSNLPRSRAYDAYGAVRSVGGGSCSSGFVGGIGHIQDDESGLIYMRARYYDPALGRFISEDPGRNGANWYAYCDGNPVNGADPTGRFDIPWMADFVVGGLLILLGDHMVKETENAALGYILGIGGVAIGGLGAALGIKAAVDWAGPIISNYVDRMSNEMYQSMENNARGTANELTSGILQEIYGQELMIEGYMMEDNGD